MRLKNNCVLSYSIAGKPQKYLSPLTKVAQEGETAMVAILMTS